MTTFDDPDPERPRSTPTAADYASTPATRLTPPASVSFLFTDLEGSTRFWEQRPDIMPAVYARHDAILRDAVAAEDGHVYKVIGDAFQIALPTPAAALRAAIAAQRALLSEPWPFSPAPRVRMAVHLCEVAPDADGDYRTPGLNRLGRLLTAADGGEILASEAIVRGLIDPLPVSVRLHDLGEHRFRDLSPQRVFQVFAPGLPEEPSRLRGLAQHRQNLPTQPTVFIGREAELRRVQDALADPAVRVLTLAGPGGIGKTRLALASAEVMVERFTDGVWFVPLGAVSEPELVTSAIARVFGVRESVDQSLLDAVVAHLAEREVLLVLDNLEQVIDAGPTVAVIRSRRAPIRSIAAMVASRTPVRAPRQPAWAAPITPACGSAKRTGAQSAVRTPRTRPRLAVTSASALGRSPVQGASTTSASALWTCQGDSRRSAVAPRAAATRPRFSWTLDASSDEP